MRVLFFLVSLELGGAERQAFMLAEHLKTKGHDIQIWGLGKPGKISSLCDETKISWRSKDAFLPVFSFHEIKKFIKLIHDIKEFNPDIIIPFCTLPSLMCALSWKFTKTHACIWNERDIGLSRSLHLNYPFAIKLSTCVVANSYESKEYIKREYNKNLDIRVINNGVHTKAPEETREKWRERLGAEESTLVYCMVANLHINKNHSLLIKAWYEALRLSNIPEDSILVLAGRYGDTTESLKQQVVNFKIQEKVRFLGPVDDISGLLTAVDVGILSSFSEGQSNAILEYMYAGLPIIASDLLSIREMLSDTGSCLFRKDSVDELTAALGQMTPADRRYKIGRNNAEKCRQLYLPEKMFDGYKVLINEMINKDKKEMYVYKWFAITILLLKIIISNCKEKFINIVKKLLGSNAPKVKCYLEYLKIKNMQNRRNDL